MTVTCRVLKIARQPYYRFLENVVSDAEWDEALLANILFDAHRDGPECGYRFLTDEVNVAGFEVCERTVWKICSSNGWWSVFGKKKDRKTSKATTPAQDDLVRRDFTAAVPNRLWAADITEHPTDEGTLCCCALKDAFSNRIVGYSIEDRMKARRLVVQAIENATARRDDVAGCILHSERGSQPGAQKVRRALAHHRMVRSMGQVGSAGGNAAMESFFSLLQKNVLDRRRWATRNELRIAIVTWLERTSHRRRRQAALGRLTSVEFEMIMAPHKAAAA